jgi:hypothetical protein
VSEAVKIVLTCLGYFAGAMFLLFLIAATCYGLLRTHDRWKEARVAKCVKRLGVKLGQRLEVEYTKTSETARYASGIEVARVFAYSGAVKVDVTPLLREEAGALLGKLADRCREAEGLDPAIPY